MLEIHNFAENHLDAAGEIALRLWETTIPGMPEDIRGRIYQYLVRYYYTPDSPLSIGASENGILHAFLLAAPLGHAESEFADKWIAGRLNGSAEHAFFNEYKAYIDGNRKREAGHALANEAVLLLFASVRRGAGRMLMAEFENRCRNRGISSMLLWTDETCDFDYYRRNRFSEVTRFPTDPTVCGQSLTTYLFRKAIG